ncbi:MAG: hypothetical protein K1X28_07405 [Parachlamydiales bacterium]|nr:hypothetical protein [Parachlamydiales bacterium]
MINVGQYLTSLRRYFPEISDSSWGLKVSELGLNSNSPVEKTSKVALIQFALKEQNYSDIKSWTDHYYNKINCSFEPHPPIRDLVLGAAMWLFPVILFALRGGFTYDYWDSLIK